MTRTGSFLARTVGLVALAVIVPAAAHTPQPTGLATDRVGLPSYGQGYTLLRRFYGAQRNRVGFVYANEAAASVTEPAGLPYPYGAILIVEWHDGVTDPAGAPVRDARGEVRAGEAVVQIDVMRRERGFGEAYGAARTGEWEYASYRADGSHATVPRDTGQCAACHQGAGAARDFVFRGRFPPASAMRMSGN